MKKILHNEITEAPFSHAPSVSAAAEVTRGSDLTETCNRPWKVSDTY